MEENSTAETSTETAEEAPEVPAKSEENTESTETKEETPAEEVAPEEDIEELKAKLASRTAFSRKHETRVKELVKEKESWKTEKLNLEGELHKAKAELLAIRKEAKASQIAGVKAKAATDFKLPEKALGYLKGETEEDILSSAQELAEIFGVKAGKTKVISTQGTPQLADSSSPAHVANLAAWAASLKK